MVNRKYKDVVLRILFWDKVNRAEVIAMSIFEYNKEEEDKKLRKAEYEAGYDDGKQEIIQVMLKAGEPLEKIAHYTGYAVEEIKDRIKNFQ